jgi:hypothetical protein
MFSMLISMTNMFFYSAEADITYPIGTADHIEVMLDHSHNSNPNPATSAARLSATSNRHCLGLILRQHSLQIPVLGPSYKQDK